VLYLSLNGGYSGGIFQPGLVFTDYLAHFCDHFFLISGLLLFLVNYYSNGQYGDVDKRGDIVLWLLRYAKPLN
jgi:hypothetical protein